MTTKAAAGVVVVLEITIQIYKKGKTYTCRLSNKRVQQIQTNK